MRGHSLKPNTGTTIRRAFNYVPIFFLELARVPNLSAGQCVKSLDALFGPPQIWWTLWTSPDLVDTKNRRV